jgi:ABC-type dipeptide/oligopeptide/nickel transport system permease component
MISHSALRFVAARAGNFLAVFLGACVLSAAIASLAVPDARSSFESFFSVFWARLPNMPALDFGTSTIFGGPAFTVLAPLLASSFDVLLMSLPLALGIGIPLGFFLADKKSRMVAGPVMQILGSVPIFCGAILVGAAFIPPGGATFNAPTLFTGTRQEAIDSLREMIPLLLLVGLAGAGAIAASVRRGFSIALAEPYRGSFSLLGLRDSTRKSSFLSRFARRWVWLFATRVSF